MATTRVTPVQLLRSEVENKRPDPAQLLAGQPAVNINANQPGLFFADQTGTSLFKVGPCAIGVEPPNTAATGAPGQLGNTVGELWLDTNSSSFAPGPTLRVWNGTAWIDCMPYRYAAPIIAEAEPSVGALPDGTTWWDSSTGLMYILYNDGSTRQWTQIASNTVS